MVRQNRGPLTTPLQPHLSSPVTSCFMAVMVSGKLTIVLVDDEPDILKLCTTVIEAYGHDVVAFESATVARERIAQGLQFDVIVTDINMSPVNGFELAEFCLEQRPGLQIVLTSGQARDSFSSDIFNNPFVKFLPKPVSPKDLESVFASI